MIANNKAFEWKSSQEIISESDELTKQLAVSKADWKPQDLALNQVAYDDSTMPAPVCSCTGILRKCYEWGNGGWRSACCTTTLSVYPLPAVPQQKAYTTKTLNRPFLFRLYSTQPPPSVTCTAVSIGSDCNDSFTAKSEISPEPVAAASLGKVYQARLCRTGQVVAVKVQRLGVQDSDVNVETGVERNGVKKKWSGNSLDEDYCEKTLGHSGD
ncbi:hypothetical protein KIW84_075932 [Lathyrus oleraceus]|uniref:GAGA-binding transcriptional activator n=1 Tax=Pisum sativum TaxID=3888 RepID=A0A9D5A1P7_PEA|nr:hypothetical protein KIW84_075932 [Pisum sativum]